LLSSFKRSLAELVERAEREKRAELNTSGNGQDNCGGDGGGESACSGTADRVTSDREALTEVEVSGPFNAAKGSCGGEAASGGAADCVEGGGASHGAADGDSRGKAGVGEGADGGDVHCGATEVVRGGAQGRCTKEGCWQDAAGDAGGRGEQAGGTDGGVAHGVCGDRFPERGLALAHAFA